MSEVKDIAEIRKEIDDIDRSLVDLYKKRMAAAAEVAAYKKEKGLPILDASRERALLSRVAEMAGEPFADSTLALYTTILALSRSYQMRLVGGKSAIEEKIRNALAKTPPMFPERATVACQGVEGAYSQIATEKLFPYPAIRYYKTFEDVFTAVENGECRYGVLPIENSTAGSVSKVYDLMTAHRFSIVRSVRQKIDHNLLSKPGVTLSDIHEIYSHEQAISQCGAFLSGLPGVTVTAVANTAVAAKMVAESERTDVAALSSRACAMQYGLTALRESVQDQGNNYTRFICLSKDTEIYPGADRTSIMMAVSHRPGSLYQVLARFYALGVNMTKLESRPIPDRDFEFKFYFDLDMPIYSPRLIALLSELEKEAEDFRYLGTYHETV